MNANAILPDDEPVSLPSEATMRGAIGPRDARPAPGADLLGRYTVLEELGQGGMGVVYKCLDREGGIEVAVKGLPPEVTRNRDELDEIRENYQIVAKLHHSAISGLRYLERDPASGDYYVVMDLAEGEDLSRSLRRRRGAPMPLSEALEILRPLAAALDYAHGEGVLHRDVKPANVKVRPSAVPGEPPRVQLLDFGLAAQVRSSMSRVSMCGHVGTSGTPAYMAPEQWEARRQTGATDQYALAVVAYEMLSGAPPFAADDTDLLRRAVLSRDPDPVDDLDPAANAALLRALAKDPKERFPSCMAFVAALAGADAADEPRDSESGNRAAPTDEPKNSAALEADVLRRKVALSRTLTAIPAEERTVAELSVFVASAETELAAAEEAFKYGRFAAAAACLDRADAALEQWRDVAARLREEAERIEREEAERREAKKRELKTQCILNVVPLVNGAPVSSAVLTLYGDALAIDEEFKLDAGYHYPEIPISFRSPDGLTYSRTIKPFKADWKGVRELRVDLFPPGEMITYGVACVIKTLILIGFFLGLYLILGKLSDSISFFKTNPGMVRGLSRLVLLGLFGWSETAIYGKPPRSWISMEDSVSVPDSELGCPENSTAEGKEPFSWV